MYSFINIYLNANSADSLVIFEVNILRKKKEDLSDFNISLINQTALNPNENKIC